jgi:hypothetical protein
MSSQRESGVAASLLPDGRVLISGGSLAGNGFLTTELYNPATGTWSDGAPTSGTRSGHTSTVLPSGQILLAGAFANSAKAVSIFTSATTLTAETLNLGDQPLGVTRAATNVRITNTGAVPLLVRGVTLIGKAAGDFTVAPGGCTSAPVAAGAFCNLAVTFTPTEAGARAVSLSFRANSGAGTQSTTVSGIGIGPDPTATPTPEPATPQPAPSATPAPTPAGPAPIKPQLLATLAFTFKAGKTSTTLTSLTLKNLQKGVTVVVKCPKGCAKKTYTTTAAKSSVSLKLLVKKALKVGTKVTVTVSKAGALGLTKTLTIRKGKAPSVSTKLGAR